MCLTENFFDSLRALSFTNIIGLSLGADGGSPPQGLSGLRVIGRGIADLKGGDYRLCPITRQG